jgi:hypothetical protein
MARPAYLVKYRDNFTFFTPSVAVVKDLHQVMYVNQRNDQLQVC